ncbi:MAG: LL-diaminopimelate aminotransferase [Lentisphaerae bacterium]|jgi:LL-diaminopimelate aminotransferase|nr:LL-diaminopimelate aminotransferase [Lentisphaerota bacterium]
MILANENFYKVQATYLFSDIARRVSEFTEANKDASVIRLGIGDVTRALPQACVDAMIKATTEMGADDTFRGYGPDYGYDFLREAIALHDFKARGADISADEIFVSDGAKCDTGNFQELFAATGTKVAVPDPVYPVYVDTNVMAGRTGYAVDGRYENLAYLDCTEANNFVPAVPEEQVDLIYLCFPNNPTGATATKEQLKAFVDYAHENKALILFDAAYEAFIVDDDIPHSIYEIEGAKEVAVEFRSFSKNAGFTGTRCGYTVVPEECRVFNSKGEAVPLAPLWKRRMSTKFNGVSYPVQRAAEAVYSEEGGAQCKALVDGYLANAKVIRERIAQKGFKPVGGDNSPYIWFNTGMDSWKFFDKLLKEAQVVTTPGSGFGRCGNGYIRISAFNSMENVVKAMDRVCSVL